MSKPKVIIIAISVAAVIGIFRLPKGVVKKEGGEQVVKAQAAAPKATDTVADTSHEGHDHAEGEHDVHETSLPASELNVLAQLRKKYTQSTGAKKVPFADSLAQRFSRNNVFDSVAFYRGEIATIAPSTSTFTVAGDAMFDAAGFSLKPEKTKDWTEKSRAMYLKALEADKSNLDAKAKLAMTYVDTENPMQGITMLREVVAVNPRNETAVYNLGLLSMRSNQYEKAISRFEDLLKINPKHLKGHYFLAISYKEAGKKEKAIEYFKKVKAMDSDPAVQDAITQNLAELEAL